MAPKDQRWDIYVPDFARIEWDENKRLATLEIRAIDFLDFLEAITDPHLRAESNRETEDRYVGVVEVDKKEYAVVYTERGAVCRIITVRRARTDERRAYRRIFGPGGFGAER